MPDSHRANLPAFAFVLAAAVAILAGCSNTPPHDAAPASAPQGTTPQTDRCRPAPFAPPLFLRGSLTNWTLDDDYAFEYACHEYLLNVDARGMQRFRIVAASRPPLVFGGESHWHGTLLPEVDLVLDRGGERDVGDLQFEFKGRHTIHLLVLGGEADPQLAIRVGPQDFVDPAAAPVADAAALGVSFDSRDPADKSPFGAIVAGTTIEVALRAPPGVRRATLVVERRRLEGPQDVLDYSAPARVALAREAAQDGDERWRGRYRFDDIGIYGYYFEIETAAGTFLYENNHDSVYWTREKGSGGQGRIETTADPLHRIRRFRQTVYRADYAVPDWARDAVFYYIFPERFRNGDRRNDPKPGPDTFHDKSVEVHANWLDKPWLPHSGDGSDDVYGNDFFGGDLAGIIDELGYIAGLGANTLYLTPIFQASSNHKYDTADYRHIDPHFGSDADFERLTREASKHGIRVLLDTSLNHSGSDSVYFDRWAKFPGVGAFDGGRIHPESPYADWYLFDATQTEPDKQYRGWAGARDLPELNKSSPSYRQFAYGAPDSIMKRWLDRGAAGWRMDVAPWVPDDFWREWRTAVKQHRPDALTVAETQFEASKYFLGDEFDSTMNYIFRNAVEDYANGKDARVVYRNIELMRELYPPQAFYALMNLLSTHDSARALYDFGWKRDGDAAGTIALAKRRLRLAVFFQMTFPGAPAVLYADEAGVTGGDDPFNRVTYPWKDLGGHPDEKLIADYRRLIGLRKTHALLRRGSIAAPAYIDEHVIVLVRTLGRDIAVVAMNNDVVAHEVAVDVPAMKRGAGFVDVLDGTRHAPEANRLKLIVPALSGTVLEKR